jgi:isopentenyl diphosphate isomerase/L-lactate dehydrogenase-like FMN-dependent dehydrogenase
MPLVIKGIQTAEDARLCVQHGADALVVSNHGGHALPGSKGTIELLPEVMDAVGDRLEVYMDGGIRRGADVLKALALGAKAVFIGRPIFWGLSVGGEAGVCHVLDILRDELNVAMGLCGVTGVRNVPRSLVQGPNGGGRQGDVVSRLERLAKLQEQGYLTREEFDTQKAKLLA